MQKGVSIFYNYHEQGSSQVIAGIYYPVDKTEEEMRKELLSLMGYKSFHERDQPTFINHTHLYAKQLLGETIDEEIYSIFKNFFPEAIDVENFKSPKMKFYYVDSGAYEFICNNRYHNELHQYRIELQTRDSNKFKERLKEYGIREVRKQ